MKVGFVGNTNNYPFRLARALRELGHEVIVFVDRPRAEPRHRPEHQYVRIPYPYPGWIREIAPLNPMQIVLYPWTLRPLVRTLEACDGVVLNGLALSLGTRIHPPVFGLLTGSDLDVFSNLNAVNNLAARRYRLDRFAAHGPLTSVMVTLKRTLFTKFIRLQRAGIARCCCVEYAIPGLLPEGDALLDEIGISQGRRTSFMMTDPETLQKPIVRPNGAFRIFCATRLQWKPAAVGANCSPLDVKGTDVMLEGLRKFVTRSPYPVKIHMIAFGADAEAAQRSIDDLGLRPYVCWRPELPPAEFLEEMSRADAVLENFGPNGCIGMAGRDAIAMGKPLVAWGKSTVFDRALGEPLPIYEAQTPDEICARLGEILDDADGVARYSSRARAFAARWFSARRAAERCVAAFEEARKRHRSQ